MRRLRSSMHALGALLPILLVTSTVSAQSAAGGRSGSRDRTPPPVVDENPYAVAEEENPYAHESETDEVTPPQDVTPTQQARATSTGAEETVPAADETADASADSGEDERTKFHALGLGWHATMFATEVRNGYTLQGPELAYTYFVGRRWGFSLRGSLFFPTSGYMAGPEGALRVKLRDAYDQSRIGVETVIGAGRRYELDNDLVMLIGMGVHVQSFRLNGTQYYPVEGITAGLGGYVRIDWHISELFSLGLDFMGAMDIVDFIGHQNRITFLAPLAGALTFGVTY